MPNTGRLRVRRFTAAPFAAAPVGRRQARLSAVVRRCSNSHWKKIWLRWMDQSE